MRAFSLFSTIAGLSLLASAYADPTFVAVLLSLVGGMIVINLQTGDGKGG